MPLELMYGSPNPAPRTLTEYAAHLRQNLEEAYQKVRDKMGHKLDQQKELYDQRIHGKPFEPGDKVWLHSPAVPRGRSRKLHRPWKGPFRVLARVTYRLKNSRNRSQKIIVHFNRLKPYSAKMRPAPSQPAAVRPRKSSSNPPLIILDSDSESETDHGHRSVDTGEQSASCAPQQPSRTPDTDAPSARRYPLRNRSAPDYYHNKV